LKDAESSAVRAMTELVAQSRKTADVRIRLFNTLLFQRQNELTEVINRARAPTE
jgi:hypothetical protein